MTLVEKILVRASGREWAARSVVTRKRVVVIEGEDAAPEAMRPSVLLIDRLGLDAGGSPFPEEARRAIDGSDATLFGATSGMSAAALMYLRWG